MFRLKIKNNGVTTYTEWVTETPTAVANAVARARYDMPDAAISIERQIGAPAPPPAGSEGMRALIDDPSPTLGGDLHLNGHRIIGVVKEPFVIDGGLL